MTELRNLLNELSDQAKVYDVAQRARVGGQRRRRRKRLALGGGAALSISSVLIGLIWGVPEARDQSPPVATSAPTASPSPTPSPERVVRCVASELPQPSGYPRKAFVTGGDPTGRYLLGRAYPKGSAPKVLLWDNGRVNAIAMSGSDPSLVDITASGVAVGSSFPGSEQVSWIYRDGVMKRLAGDNAAAAAVNENLTIVGTLNNKAARWRDPLGAPELLAMPPGEWLMSKADGISEDGHIVGSAIEKTAVGGGNTVGLMWRPDGTVELLAVPALHRYPAPRTVWPSDIRGDWIAGTLMAHNGHLYTVRWNRSTGEVVTFRDGANARRVNALGWTSGLGFPSLLLTSGRMVMLPTELQGYQGQKLPNGRHFADGAIAAISDDGRQVAGTLHDDVLVGLAVKWTCQ